MDQLTPNPILQKTSLDPDPPINASVNYPGNTGLRPPNDSSLSHSQIQSQPSSFDL